MKSDITLAASVIGWFCALALSACSPGPAHGPAPGRGSGAVAHAATPPASRTAPEIPPVRASAPPHQAGQAPYFSTTQRAGITFRGVAFDSRGHRLRVVEQPQGPGSLFSDAASAGRSLGATAVINGGFYTAEGEPLGLVVSEGTPYGRWNAASSLGSALWQEDPSGHTAIVRRSDNSRDTAPSMRGLLQAGPLLLENGAPVAGLENQKHSARTFLLWDGGHRWWLGISSPTTLAGLSRTLSLTPPVPWQPSMALNLDGGGSSQLWVAGSDSRQEINIRSPWNRQVRNFLALVPRG